MKSELKNQMNHPMKSLYKNKHIVLLLFCFWTLASSVYADENDTKVTKTINEEFLLPKNGHVEITNKYGQIVIIDSDNSYVTVRIEVIAYGKDRKAANKIMERVDFDFDQTSQYLSLETVLDRKSGAFKELWNSIGDYSKTLLSKNKLEINYEVAVPKTASISLNNKFGDIFISDRKKAVDIIVSHGNLRVNSINATSNITVSYGTAQIKHVNNGRLKFKSAEVTINSGDAIDIRSSSSEINIIKGGEIELNSRSDKRVEVGEVARLSGEMTFSKLKVDKLTKNIDINLNYSDIQVNHIPFSFSFIRIQGKSSDIDLDFDTYPYMEVDIKASEDRLSIPVTNLSKEYIDEKKGIAQYRGVIGEKNNYKGNLTIDAQRGTVNIRLNMLQQSVKSK